MPSAVPNAVAGFPDNGIRSKTSLEVLSQLPPAFTEDGTTTAANSSQITDGCACVLLMSVEQGKSIHP